MTELLLKIMATDFFQCSHYTGSLEKVLVLNRCKTRMIGNNVLLPLFNERQWGSFLYLLQQAVYEQRQLSENVVALICCSGRMNEIIGNWNRNMCYRQGDIDCAHQSLTTKFILHPKTNVESPWIITSVFPGGTRRCPPGRKTNSWAYVQISRRRCNRRNFIRAIWSM